MAIEAAVFAVVLVLVVWLLLNAHAKEQESWGRERRELLNRIQRPDYVPTMVDPERFRLSTDEEPDEIGLINTIAEHPPGEK